MIDHAKKVEVSAIDTHVALNKDEQAVFFNLLTKIDDHRKLIGLPSIAVAVADLDSGQEVDNAH
ncbi:hypothetical protein ACE1BS_19610 [Aeromonas jandaei]